MIKCPHCSAELERVFHINFEIDFCPKGHGAWFDERELHTFIHTHKILGTTNVEYGIAEDERTRRSPDEKNLALFPCPYGHGHLIPQKVSDPSLFGNVCSTCRGTWIDRAQLVNLPEAIHGRSLKANLALAFLEMEKKREEWQGFTKDVSKLSRPVVPSGILLPIFLPLYDKLSGIFPFATISLLAVNLLAFIALSFAQNPELVFERFGFSSESVFSGNVWVIVTSLFLHANFWHLIGNMWFLWMFGDNIEESLGKKRFLILYFSAGIGADVLHSFIHPGAEPAIGASGAIAGLLGAYFVLHPTSTIQLLTGFGVLSVPAFVFLFLWFLMQFYLSFIELVGATNVAYYAHIGGFLTGLMLAFFFRKGREQQLASHKAVRLVPTGWSGTSNKQ